MKLALAAALTILTVVPSVADGPDRAWPSARFRGTDGPQPPCTCRGRGRDVVVGQEVCLATPDGQRRARCVMQLNNTSWEISEEACATTALLSPAAVRPR